MMLSVMLTEDNYMKGLLVEPNPFHFRAGLYKHRKAVTINTCLATQPRPILMAYE
jgi:hypothetical protein